MRLHQIASETTESHLNDLLATLQPPRRKQLRSSEEVIKRYYRSTIDFDG